MSSTKVSLGKEIVRASPIIAVYKTFKVLSYDFFQKEGVEFSGIVVESESSAPNEKVGHYSNNWRKGAFTPFGGLLTVYCGE